MAFQSKWMDWSTSASSPIQNQGARSAESLQAAPSGTFGTEKHDRRWAILDSFSLDPVALPSPSADGPQLPFADLKQAVQQGKVVLVWSRPCQSWTYWVHDDSDVRRGREKLPSAVIYTMREIDLLGRARVDHDFARLLHISKEVLGGRLENVSRASSPASIASTKQG